MRLTTFTDYALRVLIFVATAPERRGTVAQIAEAYDISQNHLVKVAHLLGKEGYLATRRGHTGGLRLARMPAAINIGALVRITEGPSVLAECFEGGGGHCSITAACTLIAPLREADNAFYRVLDRYTLQDLVASPKRMAVILHRIPLSHTGDRP